MSSTAQYDLESCAAFYLERLLEQLEGECPLVAQRNFVSNNAIFQEVLSGELFQNLKKRVFSAIPSHTQLTPPDWSKLIEALKFGECRYVHDQCHEFLLRNNHLRGHPNADADLRKAQEVLAECRANYIEPDEICINTFINGRIQFVVSERRQNPKPAPSTPSSHHNGNGNGNNHSSHSDISMVHLKGDPGFGLVDALGKRYRCFVKNAERAKLDDILALKITNVTLNTILGEHGEETILYLEPRVHTGDLVMVILEDLSYTGNSFTFRLYSYDGFLWFKRRGINKKAFNSETLHPGDCLIVKVLYTSEEPKCQKDGKIQRLGIIKAIPVRRVDKVMVAGPDTPFATIPK